MAIPKVIYQTFKTHDIPWLTKFYIRRFRRKNPGYAYEFYDDQRIERFFRECFDERTYNAYRKLQIGAAKADFFRYAILYKYGGVYLDLDSDILVSLDEYLRQDDIAVIAPEEHTHYFAQWTLIYDKGHPFLGKTIEYVVDNIENNRFPNNVHGMTGPGQYTIAIKDVIAKDPGVAYRTVGPDYAPMMKFKYKLGKLLIYKDRSNHWKKLQERIPVLKED